jgi:hypothetical protein
MLEDIASMDLELITKEGREKQVLKSIESVRRTLWKRGQRDENMKVVMAMELEDLQTTIEEANNAIQGK